VARVGGRRRGWRNRGGLALLRREGPDGTVRWLARYRDPENPGKVKHETVPAGLTTEEARSKWAAKRAAEIIKRVDDIDHGAPTKKNVRLEDAVARFYEDNATLRRQTLRAYRLGTDAMLRWATEHRLELADNLRGEHLKALRGWLANKPLMRQEAGKARNKAHSPTDRARSPYTVNRELAPIKTCLEHLRQLGLVPMLSRDAILDNLKRVKTPRPVPEYLKPSALVALVEAAKRHDEATFKLTRDEKAEGLSRGGSPRFAPILPYLATVLLTGMRADEACSLKWAAVDLDAEPGGNVTLRPEDVKTKQGRLVDLSVSPLLREMLTAMKVRAGGATLVFGEDFTYAAVETARKRLKKVFGAPPFSWQGLRVTCGTFLANAPGIFGAASAYREARQLGHSVTVAEKHYLGVVHVSPEAKTLESAMTIEKPLRNALAVAVIHAGGQGRPARRNKRV